VKQPVIGVPWPGGWTDMGNRRASLAIWLALAGLAVLIAGARLRTYDEPLETDIMCYTVVARELLNGKRLYSEVWDIKPPGVFIVYAAALRLANDNVICAVYLLNILAAFVTMWGLFVAASVFAGHQSGLVAAAAWAFVSGDLRLQANQPNTEVFMNAAHIWAIALLLGALRKPAWSDQNDFSWLARAAGAGLLLGLAAIFKHVSFALVPPLALALWFALRRPLGRRRAFLIALAFSVSSLWAWLLAAVWFALAGRWFDFVATLFDYGLFYASLDAGGIVGNLSAGLSRLAVISPDMASLLPLAVVASAGLVAWWVSQQPERIAEWHMVALLAAFGVGISLAVVLPGRFYPHYYQLWLPFFCLSGAAGLAALGRAAPRMRLAQPRVLGGAMLLALAAIQAPYYRLSADEWSRRKYGPDFSADKALGLRVRELLQPDDRLYVWGQYAGLYVYSGARPATGFFFLVPVLWSPHARVYSERALADLKAEPPEMILEDIRDVPPYPNHPIVQWFHAAYTALPTGSLGQTRYRIWCLRSGALARRLGVGGGGLP
jgi:hypothetical protein